MIERAIYEIIRNNSGVSNISDNMNLYRDLGIEVSSLRKICVSVEKLFEVPDGTFKYILPYFDKVTVSDLVKITKSEVNYRKKHDFDNKPGFFDRLKLQQQKFLGFFYKSR